MPVLTHASAVDRATRHRAGTRVSWKQAKQQSQVRTMVAQCAEGGKEGRRDGGNEGRGGRMNEGRREGKRKAGKEGRRE